MPPADRSLRDAARDLILLAERCPELFWHVLAFPISDEDMQTLRELADFDDEDAPDAAE
jgi:hypothetical protein